MPAVSKLLPAALAAMLAVSLAEGASANPQRLPMPSDPVCLTACLTEYQEREFRAAACQPGRATTMRWLRSRSIALPLPTP
ncbi:hypothetical protein [Bradyrhizobium paxllaeri]|uniref:hypothetical protein n=1 Tax=Bradyrhizobium paxllaeri TaxID=190148 RepID=UPI001146A1E2|nr:hypothetical protein [Bradyrhizobium paxllaeri]